MIFCFMIAALKLSIILTIFPKIESVPIGGSKGAPGTPGSKFFHFHAVFGKKSEK